jgi:hypothetical protein
VHAFTTLANIIIFLANFTLQKLYTMRSFSYLAFSALLIASCHKGPRELTSTVKQYPSFSSGPQIPVTTFPLTVGNMWVYDNKDTVTAVADTLIGSIQAVKMIRSNGHIREISYYASTTEGLFHLGSNCLYANAIVTAEQFPSDTMRFHNTPVQLVKYNCALNIDWPSHDSNSQTPYRKWTDYISIISGNITRNCVKMNTESSYVTEYYSDRGLEMTWFAPVCFDAPCNPRFTRLVYTNF